MPPTRSRSATGSRGRRGSFGLNARWKNISLFASFLYEFGGQRYNSTLVSQVENANLERYNVDKRVSTDRWKKPGDVAPLKDIKDRSLVTRPTSRFIQDYNTLQFNSLSISYDFPAKLVKRWGLGMLRLTAIWRTWVISAPCSRNAVWTIPTPARLTLRSISLSKFVPV